MRGRPSHTQSGGGGAADVSRRGGPACQGVCVCWGGGAARRRRTRSLSRGTSWACSTAPGSPWSQSPPSATATRRPHTHTRHPHTPHTHASAAATSPCTHTTARPRGPRTAHLAAAEGMASCAARGPGRQDRLGVIPGCTPRGPGRAVSRGALANDRQTATCSRGVQAEADSRRDRGRGRGPRRDASRRRKGPPPPRRATAVGSQAADVARVSRRPAPSSPTLPRRRRPTYV